VSFEQRRPGLGRKLARASLVLAFGLPIVLLVGALFGIQLPYALKSVLRVLLLGGLGLSPLLALSSMIATSLSLPRPAPAGLDASDAGLRIVRGGLERWIDRASIAGGIVVPRLKGPQVRLYLRNGDVVTLQLQSGIAAHRLLDQLGIDAERRRVSVPVGSPNRPLVAGCLGGPFIAIAWLLPFGFAAANAGMGAVWPYVLYLAGFTLTLLWIVANARPKEIVVGSDGVRGGGVLRDRWFAYSTIESVEDEGGVLALKVREAGRSRRIPLVNGPPEEILALSGRIRLAMALGSNEAGGEPVGEILDPRGRPLAAWREALGKLASPAGDYRRSPISQDALLALLSDPDEAPGRRIGAALALRIAEHPEAPARIRIAAEACADDRMRVALEEAAEGEIEERTLRRALK
jgi:hypothetical protein